MAEQVYPATLVVALYLNGLAALRRSQDDPDT